MKRRKSSRQQNGTLASDTYLALLFDLATSIHKSFQGQPLVVSIAGSQGSGKSTLAALLGEVLISDLGLSSHVISIDDFYLSKAERNSLAERVHPMLATRGVPGTHDLRWLAEVKKAHVMGQKVECPVFDKATDDRRPRVRELEPAAVLICEGWCWGAKPEPVERLQQSINPLEASHDPDGRWRGFVNDQLRQYQPVFESDCRVFLSVPSLAAVVDWRWQQEQDLLRESGRAGFKDRAEVENFVAYYERITRWMLEDMPSHSDMVAWLDSDHHITRVTLQH